ncbi:PLDc N-terminal domain-containing protein [Marinilactibacillus kalidii]|uniref:PLDc N-terminal domain-containing protein n=1 Tax=Marinilactibacillus kalidii TaxID=2820274 RepID=UPI001ABDFDAC|nr:PLD nuclease N-terminal domain-containing protein [Marinilactibacillus kalidii]
MNTEIPPFILDNWLLFLPILLIQLTLMATALVHVIRHDHYRIGNRAIWIALIVFVQIVGPVLYFVFGKEEDE